METLATTKKEQNISLVQQAYADFAAGNIPGILDVCTDDISWGSYENPIVPYGKTYPGKKGVAEFFSTLGSSINYTSFQPREFFADSDTVFVKGYQAGVVKSTGKNFGHDFLMEFRMKDGKVCYFFAYVDSRDQADAFRK